MAVCCLQLTRASKAEATTRLTKVARHFAAVHKIDNDTVVLAFIVSVLACG